MANLCKYSAALKVNLPFSSDTSTPSLPSKSWGVDFSRMVRVRLRRVLRSLWWEWVLVREMYVAKMHGSADCWGE